MKNFRGRSFLLCCIVLMLALAASPVMAQQAETATPGQVVSTSSASETKATVGKGVPLEFPEKETPASADSGTTSGKKQDPNGGTPARTKATITGVIIIASVATAIILALALRGGKKATVISAGIPRVGTP